MLIRKSMVTGFVLTIALFHGAVHAARTLEHEADIPAPVAEVWSAFTTAEGFMSWAVPKAEVDLRVGGEMRTSYNPASNLHDEHTIVNRILAYEPERMLAMQNVQAPKGFAHAELFQDTWSVVYFELTGPHSTHVRIIGMGYGEGPEWDEVYNKFQAGNAFTLQKLREKFVPESGDAGTAAEHHPLSALDIITRLVGGEWIHESTQADGAMFRVRNVMTLGPDGKSVVGQSWLGDATGMFDHGDTIIYRQPGTLRTMFFSINELGAISQGEIRAVSEDSVEWDWNLTSLEGGTQAFRVRTTLADTDDYQFTLLRENPDGAWEPMAELEFTRVKTAPPAFHMMKELPHTQD